MSLGRFLGLSDSERSSLEGPSLPRGAIRLDTSIGAYDSESLALLDSKIEKGCADIVWATPDRLLRIESHWLCDDPTGVWRRRDTLYNDGPQSIVVNRILARFLLAPGQYEVYSQSSKWCKENQGSWQQLQHGGIALRCEGGQTCRGASPFVCVREIGQKAGIAFHVLPRGNWTIRVGAHTAKTSPLAFIVVELGLDDDHLRLNLAPRQALELPEILFQPLHGNDLALSAPSLHRYLYGNLLPAARSDFPVVYNTWFYVNEWFTVEGLRKQLAAAKRIGCEVFVVDAGWYGIGSGGWSELVGDWREKLDGAFRGQMAAFAADVRAAGLGFGLWMEPERLGATVPVVREHPQWLVAGGGGFYYPNLDNADCFAYILSEMSRLIETYKLAWMKVDFNFERGVDATGAEYYSYYRAWYRLMDQLRTKYPDVFFEGCSSGGLRLDLSTLCHFNGHFLSDTVTPLDVLRITQGALLRLPPGRITRWCVLSAAKQGARGLTLGGGRSTNSVVAPVGATWDRSTPTDVDFAACVALPGMFGVSGDIAGLPQAALDRLRYHVAFFKKWRAFIVSAVAHLLTLPGAIEDGKGWAAMQLQNPVEKTSLLFAYRLDDAAGKMRFRLRDLDATRSYAVASGERSLGSFTGKKLMDDGVTVEIAARNSARVIVITPS